MESKNRNVLIAVVVVLLLACCCLAAAGVAAASWFAAWPFDWRFNWSPRSAVEAEMSQTYPVGTSPSLQIDNFAGDVTVRVGEPSEVRVVATRHAPLSGDIDRIEVQIEEQGDGLLIQTRYPGSLGNAWVRLEITAPADSDLDLSTGAGNVEVRGLKDSMGADSGAGNIEYWGVPLGELRFETGAGNITLHLPADLNAQVDLQTGVGTIRTDFAVVGQVSLSKVEGVIGTGDEATIYGSTGAGNIALQRQ